MYHSAIIETQKSILSASYDLLLENGFGTVTVEKIAERAGVNAFLVLMSCFI
jgi:AcrR family transcriptional regulator